MLGQQIVIDLSGGAIRVSFRPCQALRVNVVQDHRKQELNFVVRVVYDVVILRLGYEPMCLILEIRYGKIESLSF